MIVLDAGVWATALTEMSPPAEEARRLLTNDDQWVLPSHGHVETLRTIRRLEAHNILTEDEAQEAVNEVSSAEVITVAPEPWLLHEIWTLRHNVSPYDAAYVALAQRYECSLATFDKRLARAAAQYGVSALVPGSHGSL